MNLIILEPQDFVESDRVQLTGRRFDHITQILKTQPGEQLTLGLLNGNIGRGTLLAKHSDRVLLQTDDFPENPPPTLPVTLILGLPRPRMLARSLQTIATMGVEKLCLIQTSRVEKSFWQSPLLQDEQIRQQLILGLEQGKATQLPEVVCYQRFRPFIEDVLPAWGNGAQKLIAHPGPYPSAAPVSAHKTLLAIGPEGGFIEGEVERFEHLGYQGIQLGARILRVETAIPVLLGKLF